ncbi:uncharacterized protein [Montipora capricornis]|uniref:uncharacterized protein n=1 Tax=Montipora capricornis TaxID=246305 RepID=UPI0035F1C205
MALPFIPHEKIPRVFQRLRLEATTEPLKALVEFIQANWVYSTTFPPENWSVYGQPVRTNNDVEGWHNALNRRASGRSDIPFYQLIEAPRMEAQLVELQMQLVADQKLSRIQRNKYRNHQKKIFNLWGQYSDGEKSVDQLLKAISFMNDPTVRQR